jgi:hypothetical protein
LVNHAWSKSFGRAEVAAKAVSVRGWGPLNYVPLIRPKLIPMASLSVDKQADSSGSTTLSSSGVNLNGTITSCLLDQILLSKSFEVGRKKKWEETKHQLSEKNGKIDMLRELTNVASSTLGTASHFVFDDTIAAKVASSKENKDEEKEKQNERKKGQQGTQQVKVREAICRVKQQQVLRTEDYRALISRFKLCTDSPLKAGAKAADIKATW